MEETHVVFSAFSTAGPETPLVAQLQQHDATLQGKLGKSSKWDTLEQLYLFGKSKNQELWKVTETKI